MKDRKGYYISDQYASYFVTFTVVGWVDVFTRKECKKIIIDALKYCQENKGLVINAFVIMSNHIHMIIRAKEETSGLSDIIRDFKRFTAKSLLQFLLESKKESRSDWMKIVFSFYARFNKRNSKYQFWKQNNQPNILLHPKFIAQKLNYIHNNPVEAEIVDKAEHYKFSSAHDYVNRNEGLVDIEIIDFGVEEGYLFT